MSTNCRATCRAQVEPARLAEAGGTRDRARLRIPPGGYCINNKRAAAARPFVPAAWPAPSTCTSQAGQDVSAAGEAWGTAFGTRGGQASIACADEKDDWSAALRQPDACRQASRWMMAVADACRSADLRKQARELVRAARGAPAGDKDQPAAPSASSTRLPLWARLRVACRQRMPPARGAARRPGRRADSEEPDRCVHGHTCEQGNDG